MRIDRATITNFRGIRSLPELSFDKINIVLGVNTSGKTSLLLALSMLNAAFISESIGVKKISDLPLHSPQGVFNAISYGDVFRRVMSSSKALVHALGDVSTIKYYVGQKTISVRISKMGTIEVADRENILKEFRYGDILLFLPIEDLINGYLSLMSTNAFWERLQKEKLYVELADIVSKLMPIRITEIIPPIYVDGRSVLGVRIEEDGVFYLPITDLSTSTKKVLTLLTLYRIFEPKVLIVDDIDAFLDTPTLKGLVEYLISRNNQVILATHSLDTIVGVYESKIKDVQVVVLSKVDGSINVKTLPIEEAMEHIEAGIDIRIVPPGD